MKQLKLFKKSRILHPLFTLIFLLFTTFSMSSFKEDLNEKNGIKKLPGLGKLTYSGGDFSIDFAASKPSLYDHSTGGGFFHDKVESLEGGDFKCGDLVSYLTQITVDGSAIGSQTVKLNYSFLADATGASGIGQDDIVNVLVSEGANQGVTSTATLSDELLNGTIFTMGSKLTGSVTVDGLEAGEVVVVRIDVHLACQANANPTGNLQGAFMSGATVPDGDVVNGGNQTIPFKQINNVLANTCAISPSDAICGSSTNTYTATSTSTGSTYVWSITGDGTIVDAVADGTKTTTSSTNTSSVDVIAGVSGSYTLSVSISKDGFLDKACSQTITVNAIPTAPKITADYKCDGTVTLSTDALGTLLWSTTETTSSISVTSAGTYKVTATLKGCTSGEGSIDVTTPKSRPAAPTITADYKCDGTVTLSTDADASASLLWSPSGETTSTISVNAAGTYKVTATLKGCTSGEGSIDVTTPKSRPAAPTITSSDDCDGKITLTATGDGTFVFKNSAGEIIPSTGNTAVVTAAGTYTVTVTGADGCESDPGSKTVTTPKSRPANPVGDDQTACSPASLTATATGSNVVWYYADGAPVTNPTLTTVGSVTYYAESSSDDGCTSAGRTAITLTINPLPTATIDGSTAVCVGATAPVITFTGANGTAPYKFTYKIAIDGKVETVTTTIGNSVTVAVPTTAYSATFDYILLSVQDASTTACSQTQSGTATITINPLPPCTISNTTSSSSQTAVVGASVGFSGPSGTNFSYAWSFSANTSGATFAGGTSTSQTVTVTTSTIGSYTLSLTVTDNTYPTKCNATCTYNMSATPVGPSVTYTQGFYGNSGGKSCNKTLIYSYDIMKAAVTAAGGSIRFGNQTDTRSFTLMLSDVNAGKISNIFKMLPGGTTPAVLKGTWFNSITCNFTTATFTNKCTWTGVPMTPSINNVLLAQTMALRFNLFYSNYTGKPLGGLRLYGNVLKFAKLTTACGSVYSTTTTIKTIPCTVWNIWKGMTGGATIDNLYTLANDVLGGVNSSITPSDMNNALNIINVGLDGGGQIVGVSLSVGCTAAANNRQAYVQNIEQPKVVTELTVSTYPNPFTDRVKFRVVSPVSGNASLDIYNMMGQKVGNAYQGYLQAGRGQVIDYNVPVASKGSLIYTLRVGDQQVNGKVIHLK